MTQVKNEELIKNPDINASQLSLILNKSKRTIERYLKLWQEQEYILHEVPNKNGVWKVIK